VGIPPEFGRVPKGQRVGTMIDDVKILGGGNSIIFFMFIPIWGRFPI